MFKLSSILIMLLNTKRVKLKPTNFNHEISSVYPKLLVFYRSSFSLMGPFHDRLYAVEGKGIYITLNDGRKILDGCSGAAVSNLGHKNIRVIAAMNKQNRTGITYIYSSLKSKVVENLCEFVIKETNNAMSRAFFVNSGSEANEVAIKLAYTYHVGNNDSKRINIMARRSSYHGATVLTLSTSEFEARQEFYAPILNKNNVFYTSPCYTYREQIVNESNKSYVARIAAEFEAKLLEIGPETVMAFILEPVVGAALGCVPYVPGYLKAIKEICVKYGVLLIFDEIMCGIGRTGYLHA